jgi:ribose transport system ATP-binding protein
MHHITKRFPGILALNDVSFAVQAGTIHGLVGENGAGKSTLMKILSGIYRAGTYEGEINLNGKTIQLRTAADALEQGIGIVPQEISVIDQLTVAENVVVGRWTQPGSVLINMRAIKRDVKDFLEAYNIALNPGALMSSLTTAQKQQVMIARALYRKPSVLILDEPTSSLAIDEIDHLFASMNTLREKGLTTVFITHKLTEIFELADRTTVLRDGQVAGEFPQEG